MVELFKKNIIMNKSILYLIVLLAFANCFSDDDCGSDMENVNAECIFETQESLYVCCYSSQREIVSLPANDCPPDIDSSGYDRVKYLGFFEPLESTFKMLPSMEEGRNFIFQNQHGEYITLNYEHHNLRIGSSKSELHVSDSITLLCTEKLHYDISVSSEELDYKMNISISTKVSYSGEIIYLNDFLVLRRSDSLGVFRSWPGQLNLTIDKRNSLEEHLYSSNNVHFEEIALNDFIFQNIYTDSLSFYNGDAPLNTYYFSYDYGLVGIKDEFDNLWVLNKIE
jgi:hypothetical protein